MNTKLLNTIPLDGGKVIVKKGSGGGGGSPIIHILAQQRDIEEYDSAHDYYIIYDRYIDIRFNLDTREIVQDSSYKLTREGGENDEKYYREYISACRYDQSDDELIFSSYIPDFAVSMVPNRAVLVKLLDFPSESFHVYACEKGVPFSFNGDAGTTTIDSMRIRY